MDALDKPGKHRVFKGGVYHTRWIAYCPYNRQNFPFPTWEMAMSLRNCCAANYSSRYPNVPATQTITDIPTSERARDWMRTSRMGDG